MHSVVPDAEHHFEATTKYLLDSRGHCEADRRDLKMKQDEDLSQYSSSVLFVSETGKSRRRSFSSFWVGCSQMFFLDGVLVVWVSWKYLEHLLMLFHHYCVPITAIRARIMITRILLTGPRELLSGLKLLSKGPSKRSENASISALSLSVLLSTDSASISSRCCIRSAVVEDLPSKLLILAISLFLF